MKDRIQPCCQSNRMSIVLMFKWISWRWTPHFHNLRRHLNTHCLESAVLSHPCLTSPVQFCLTFHDGSQQYTLILSLHHPAPEFPETVLKLSDYISRPVVGETVAVQGEKSVHVHFYFSTSPISLVAGGINQKIHQNHYPSWYLFQNWQKWSYWVYEQI